MSSLSKVAVLPIFLLLTAASAQQAFAQASWRVVGKRGSWGNTMIATGADWTIYSVEANGLLYATTRSGAYRVIGNSYRNTRMLVWMDDLLFNVQGAHCYVTNPRSGRWWELGGNWTQTAVMTAMNGYLWSLEQNGTLYRTDRRGNSRQIGARGGLRSAQHLVALNGKLYALSYGTLYRMDPTAARWEELGVASQEWTELLLAAGGYLWSLDAGGTLMRVNENSEWSLVGKSGEYAGISLLVILEDEVYAVKNGTMYRTW